MQRNGGSIPGARDQEELIRYSDSDSDRHRDRDSDSDRESDRDGCSQKRDRDTEISISRNRTRYAVEWNISNQACMLMHGLIRHRSS
jgi:hypothetical protein